MREVDRAMIEDFGITLLQMMENAGRNLAEVVIRAMLANAAQGKRVVVVAGPGGNGGGALVAARHLHNRGCDVAVLLAVVDESNVAPAVARQIGILREIGILIEIASESDSKSPATERFQNADIVVDGLLGYSLRGNPREPAASIIRQINESGVPVISNDIPSGVDSTTGVVYESAIQATATITIALPKTGFDHPEARRHAGDLYLGDISVPGVLYKRFLGVDVSALFAQGSIVRLPDQLTDSH